MSKWFEQTCDSNFKIKEGFGSKVMSGKGAYEKSSCHDEFRNMHIKITMK